MSVPKKHRFVPQMLLDRFADDGWLWHFPIEREFDVRRTRPREIGHVNDGHTFIACDGSKDRLTLEREMSSIESEASRAIRRLEDDSSISTVPEELRVPLAWLASLQNARSRDLLGYLAREIDALSKVDDELLSKIELQGSMLRVTTLGVLNSWAMRDDESARPKERWDSVAHELLHLRWDVLRYSDRCLAVSDAFAAQYGVRDDIAEVSPGFQHDSELAKFGLNVPRWAAKGFTVALTPSIALHIHRAEVRRPVAAAVVNMHTIRSARSFVAFPADLQPDDVLPGWIDWISESRTIRTLLPKSI